MGKKRNKVFTRYFTEDGKKIYDGDTLQVTIRNGHTAVGPVEYLEGQWYVKIGIGRMPSIHECQQEKYTSDLDTCDNECGKRYAVFHHKTYDVNEPKERTALEILVEAFEPVQQSEDLVLEDVQLAITLNPNIDNILSAMRMMKQ